MATNDDHCRDVGRGAGRDDNRDNRDAGNCDAGNHYDGNRGDDNRDDAKNCHTP